MAFGETTSEEIERVATGIVDAAFVVHHKMGPGLLESIYEVCLCRELTKRGFRVQRQVPVPVVYDGEVLDAALRLDLLVEDLVIVEVKSAERIEPIFKAVVLTYLKLTQKRLGLLINFNVVMFKDGVRRIVH